MYILYIEHPEISKEERATWVGFFRRQYEGSMRDGGEEKIS